VNFGAVEKDSSGDAYRRYSYNQRQGSRSQGGSGAVRLKDTQPFDYVDSGGTLRRPVRDNAITAVVRSL